MIPFVNVKSKSEQITFPPVTRRNIVSFVDQLHDRVIRENADGDLIVFNTHTREIDTIVGASLVKI